MENYIGLILDERNDLSYRETWYSLTLGFSAADLQKLKEFRKEMLECSNVTDCKILKVKEIK